MDIRISKKFYSGQLNDFDNFCKKRFGSPTAKLITRRIENARAVENLSILMRPGFPGRWHWLSGNRKYQISADLKDLKRLLFTPIEEPKEFDSMGILDNKKVLGIIIIEIADTHNE